MSAEESSAGERVRSAEVVAALCLATDLGMGFPLRALSDAERADVRAAVEDALARFATSDGYELPCVALCAVAS